jgi:poly(3-hydroxybutyrate) depolymerase
MTDHIDASENTPKASGDYQAADVLANLRADSLVDFDHCTPEHPCFLPMAGVVGSTETIAGRILGLVGLGRNLEKAKELIPVTTDETEAVVPKTTELPKPSTPVTSPKPEVHQEGVQEDTISTDPHLLRKADANLRRLINSDGPDTESDAGKHNDSSLDLKRKLEVEDKQREFEIHLPKDYDGSKPIPVMYLMPGFGGNIAQMKSESSMNSIADQKGFAVVYLQQLPKDDYWKATSWNLDHGSLTGKDPTYDDLNYVKAVKSLVDNEVKVDPAAQYIVGFSEGGAAAQYVAKMMPGTFAGVGSAHGTHLQSDPEPNKGDPTTFVAIHGDDDNMLAWSGGHGIGEMRGQGWLGFSPIKGFMGAILRRVHQSEPYNQAPLWAKSQQAGDPTVTDDGYNRVTSYTSPSGATVTEILRHGNGPQIVSVPYVGIKYALGYATREEFSHTLAGGQHAFNNGDSIRQHGWYFVGQPDPTENDSETLVRLLLQFRKPGE